MAEASKDELGQLIRRFGAFLTVKFSNLFSSVSFNGLNSRSIGAIAGFAIAVVFTWRLLRSPRGAQRRVQKRQAPSASSSSAVAQENAAPIASGASNASEDLRAQNVVDEFFQPVKPTLGQIVRQRLNDGRKVSKGNYSRVALVCLFARSLEPPDTLVIAFLECIAVILNQPVSVTCRLLGVILEETDPEELQKKATVRSSVLEVLLEITKFCDVYLMESVLDDESEKKVLLALEYAGVFTSGGLVKDKVLFCSTENGRASFVRQLEPDWHIDTNSEIISQLARFIKYQLHISPTRTERTSSNVFSSPYLEQFFGSN